MPRFIKRSKPISLLLIFTFIFTSIYLPGPAYGWHYPWDQGHKTTKPEPPESTNPPANPNRDVEGDDVDIQSGNFSYTHQDLFIPGRGLSIEISRTYNSQDKYNGILGYGWCFNYDLRLYRIEDSGEYYVIIRQGEGERYKFKENPDGSYTSPAGRYSKLTKVAQEEYLLTTKEGTKYKFAYGLLTSITERNNNQLSFAHSSEGRLSTLTDPTGRKLNFSYDANGKLATLKDWTDRTITYTYDASGNLVSVTDPLGNATNYSYDAEHNLTDITDPKGTTYLRNWYDSQERVTQQFFNGGYFYFSYYPSSNYTIFTDRRGNKTSHYYNSSGNPIKIVDPLGNTTTKTWDANMNLTSTTLPKGNSIHYDYDEKGNLRKITRKPNPKTAPLPPELITTFTYEANFNFVKTITDPRGNTTIYYYDYEEATLGDLNGDGLTNQNKGNLVKILYPETIDYQPSTIFTYNQYGQVETVTDPNGVVTKYLYYPDTGYLKQLINDFGLGRLNYTTEMGYDSVGNVTSTKNARGDTTTFSYNALNQLTQVSSPLPFNYISKYSYDENGNLIKLERQADEAQTTWQSTTYTYNSFDQLEKLTDHLGNVTTFSYDANGNRTKIIDVEGNSTTYEYDKRDLLFKVTDALSNTTEYAYDKNGNLNQLKDAQGNTTTYTYADFDRLLTTTYADGSSETYTYDKNSNLFSKTNQRNETIAYSYDSLNRLTLKSYPDTSKVQYQYDVASRLTAVTASSSAISYNYDNLNRIKTVTSTVNSKQYTVNYQYDALGNRTRLTYPDTTYISYEYDQLNRLTTIKDQTNNTIASYSYDPLSRRTQLALANNTQTSYQYDNINRLTQLANQLTGQQANYAYTYDKVGNRKTMQTTQGTHNYSYDKLSQLTKADYPPGFAFTDTTYTYDKVGNRTQTVNGGTTSYSTNPMDQYTQVAGTTYTYDANGNLTNDATNTYAYDYENRLTSATKTGMSAAYAYDPFGRRRQKEVSINNQPSTTNYVYDGDQVIAETDAQGSTLAKYIYGPGIDEPILMQRGGKTYYYHFDGLSSVTALTDSTGTKVESYSYDVYGLPNTTSSIGNPFLFTGRHYDEETGLYYHQARYYSPRLGRFLQTDPVGYIAGINLYTYCDNNPINYIDPKGHCKGKGLLWYDRLALWASTQTEEAKDIVISGMATNAWGVYGATTIATIMEFGMGVFYMPSAIGHLGEGIGTFIAKPSLETSVGLFQDVSLTATVLAVAFSAMPSTRGGTGVKPDVKDLDRHAIKSMQKRGWDIKEIQEAVKSGKSYPAIDKTTGGQPATRYVHPKTGKSVVINNKTGHVIQLGGKGFKF